MDRTVRRGDRKDQQIKSLKWRRRRRWLADVARALDTSGAL